MQCSKSIVVVTVFFTFTLSSLGLSGGLKKGQEIKVVTTGNEQYQGILYSMDSESVTVSSKWGQKRINRVEVAQMWTGKPETLRGAFVGVFAGIAGGLTYYLIDRNDSQGGLYSDIPRPIGDYKKEIFGACAVGLVFGAMIGMAFTTWSPVDEAEFSFAPGTISETGLGIQVSLRF